VRTLQAARLAADVCNVPTVLVARTDALSATLLTSDVDERDHEFITGERTPEGFFRVSDGLAPVIARMLAYAPYADVLWFETSTPDLDEALACAPPFDQRSCCQTAIRLPAFVGLGFAATNGSTSLLLKTVPPAAGAAHAATGLGLTDTVDVNAATAAAATASATIDATASAVEGTNRLMYPPLVLRVCGVVERRTLLMQWRAVSTATGRFTAPAASCRR
jgi:hypothetical protein